MMSLTARTFLLAAFPTLGQPTSYAQTDSAAQPKASTQLRHDVASIKPHNAADNRRSFMNKPDGLVCTNITLKSLITSAYGTRYDLISGGSSWIDSTSFDVEAKVASQDVEAYRKLTWRQKNALLQQLLADRFQLKLHHETKTLPLYNLVVDKGGFLLKPLPPFTPPPDAAKDSEAAKRPS